MSLRVVSMDELKLQVLQEPERSGDTVAEVCRRRGISRQTFYLYRRRYLEQGLAGLEPRSTRPRFSPPFRVRSVGPRPIVPTSHARSANPHH